MHKKYIRPLIVLIFACSMICCKKPGEVVDKSIAEINFSVVKTYPHATTSFTEGLSMYQGQLFESTGSPSDLPETRSLVGNFNFETGQIETKLELDRAKFFGEGIVFLKDQLFQLTYTTKVGFVYDAKTFRKTGEFAFKNKEGWGLTTDGVSLIMSDGTHTLTFINPSTFAVVKTIDVQSPEETMDKLNELEFINGFIYANVYTTNTIVKINPETGEAVGKIDCTSIAQDARAKNLQALEMNGIAYDAAKGTVYLTGKFWPTLYEVKFSY
jgi:glutaminyl-peptide cyclotransferase